MPPKAPPPGAPPPAVDLSSSVAVVDDAAATKELARQDAAAKEADALRMKAAAAEALCKEEAAERLRQLETLRARERAATHAREELEALVRNDEVDAAWDDGTDGNDSTPDVQSALVFHEAAALASLHAQAVAVQNIQALVPVTLDLAAPNFTKWRDIFLLTLGKYSLTAHVLSDDVHPSSADWRHMNCVVITWMHNTMTTDLAEICLARGASARRGWLNIEQQFLGNRETRALYLDAKFRNFMQGNLDVSTYCRKLKGMADALADLGEPVHDCTLVLAVLRGLNEKFAYMAALLKRQRPFPTFQEVRSDLELEEETMPGRPLPPAQAFTVTGAPSTRGNNTSGGVPYHAPPPGPSTPAAARPPAPPSQGGSGGSSNNNRRRRGKGSNSGNRDNNNRNSGSASATHQPRWPLVYDPWIGTIQMWPGPAAGPRPVLQRPSVPQAFTALQAPHGLPPGYPAVPSQLPPRYPPQGLAAHVPLLPPPGAPASIPVWNLQDLAHAFQSMQLTPPPTGDWFMDSGADAHMTSTPGSSLQERDRQVQ